MFRVNKKSMSALLIVIAMSVAACNNVTGPSGNTGSPAPTREPREPEVFDKACIDDLRAVAITNPSESRIVHVGDLVVITWEAQHVCGNYDALVEISYDDGRSYQQLGEKKNGVSMSWHVGDREGGRAKIRVTVTDILGTLSEEMALAGAVQSRRDQGPDRDQDEHD
jgi:hypothetical protein